MSSAVRGRRPSERDSGASAVEFALLLPVLMAVLFGIVNFGRAYAQKIELTAAAREGARTMAIKKNEADARTTVKNAAPSFVPAIADGDITISTSTCPPNTSVTVTVTRSFTYDFLVLSLPSDLKGVGVMRC